MTAAVDKKDAQRKKAFHSAKDYETSASQIGEIAPTEPDQRRKVQLLVADQVPKGEINDILMMLGIHPDQPDWDDSPSTAPKELG